MSELRDWYWAIGGRGPDYFFYASFPPAAAEHLAALLRWHPPRGFRLYRPGPGAGSRYRVSDRDFNYEDSRYDVMAAAFEGRLRKNVYAYEFISVCGHEFRIERAFGGATGDGRNASETLLMLAQSPPLTWVKWEVTYGGDGYDGGTVAEGETGAELQFYLTGRRFKAACAGTWPSPSP